MKRHHSVNFYIAIISFLLFAVVVNAQEGSSEPMGNDPSIDVELEDAILRGDLNAVRGLLDKGANANAMIYGEQALHLAVRTAPVGPRSYQPELSRAELEEREEIVRLLLDRGADANFSYGNGKSAALFSAINANNVTLMKLLLDRGAKGAFLTQAVSVGRIETVKVLLEHGEPVNQRDDKGYYEGLTPLVVAIKNDNGDITRLLINNDADVNLKDDLGNTPLFYARERSSKDMIDLLTGKGAQESIWDSSVVRGAVRTGVFLMLITGLIILIFREHRRLGPYRSRSDAARSGCQEAWRPSVIRIIKGDRWANIALGFSFFTLVPIVLLVYASGSVVGYFWKCFWIENLYSLTLIFVISCLPTGVLFMIIAVRTRHVRSLFEKGVEVQCRGIEDISTDPYGTYVDLRRYEYSYGGNTYRFIAKLIVPGYLAEIALVDPDNPGRAILRDNFTQESKKQKKQNILVSDAGGEKRHIDKTSESGKEKEEDEIDFNLLYSGPTASLVKAVVAGDVKKVSELTAGGADIEDGGEFGITPLMWASGRGHLTVVKYCIEKGAAINRANNTGTTPLMFAAKGGYRDIVELLLERGADSKAKDKSGFTALDMARKKGNKDVIHLLARQ